MPKQTVLVIDDEKNLIELVRYNLEKEGFEVRGVQDGESGLAAVAQERPGIVIVDLMLPGIDGLEVCRRLRTDSQFAGIPLIILTAKTAEADRVVGLEMGADDYVTKPFSPRELAARIRALLRRTSPTKEEIKSIEHKHFSVDVDRREVICDDTPVELTATEFKILYVLASHPGHVYARNELVDNVMGRTVDVHDRTIDVHIMALRKKLGRHGGRIETVRGFGYRFSDAEVSF